MIDFAGSNDRFEPDRVIDLNRKTQCIGNKDKTKLVAATHGFENYLSKQVIIQIDNAGKILRCIIGEKDKVANIIENGKIVLEQSQREVKKGFSLESNL